MQRRKKPVSHTLSVKLNAITEYEKGSSTVKEISDNLGVDASTIRKWIKRKDKFKEWTENLVNIPKQRKRTSIPIHHRLDEGMWLWFSQQRSAGVPLCGAIIKQEAKQFYEELGGTVKFTASNGWLRCWQKRYDIRSVTISGEKLSANIAAVEPFKLQFLNYIKVNNLTVDQVFNCDETGLNYKLLPNTTYSAKSEASPSGLKGYKERLTVMACSNVSGNFKLPLTVIGKYAKPRALKNVALPVSYKSQRSAWMTNDLFAIWFNDEFVPAVLNFLKEKGLPPKALLVMDNCSAHKAIQSRDGIDVMWFPPNTTSLIQPMDQGCLQNFKVLYKEQLMEFMVKTIDQGNNLTEAVKKITIKDGILWAAEAWKNVSVKTIQNSWNKIWPKEDRTICESNADERINLETVIASFLHTLQNHPLYKNIDQQQLKEWLYPQFSLTCGECLNDSEIIQEVVDEFPESDIQCYETKETTVMNSIETEPKNLPKISNVESYNYDITHDTMSLSISKRDVDLCFKYTRDYCSNNNYPQEIIHKLDSVKDDIQNYGLSEE